MSRPAVFLDRDGVLNRCRSDGGTTRPPAGVDDLEIVPGARGALERLGAAGYVLVVVTNQPDVARGTTSEAAVERINVELRRLLPVDDLRTCPHDDGDGCGCRKPAPGMILEAADELDLDLAASVLVGDRWSDVAAARSAGCGAAVLVGDRPGVRPDGAAADAIVATVVEAVDWILGGRSGAAAGRVAG